MHDILSQLSFYQDNDRHLRCFLYEATIKTVINYILKKKFSEIRKRVWIFPHFILSAAAMVLAVYGKQVPDHYFIIKKW